MRLVVLAAPHARRRLSRRSGPVRDPLPRPDRRRAPPGAPHRRARPRARSATARPATRCTPTTSAPTAASAASTPATRSRSRSRPAATPRSTPARSASTPSTPTRSRRARAPSRSMSDMHNLFPTRDDVNSSRGNLPFGESPDALDDQLVPPRDEPDGHPDRGHRRVERAPGQHALGAARGPQGQRGPRDALLRDAVAVGEPERTSRRRSTTSSRGTTPTRSTRRSTRGWSTTSASRATATRSSSTRRWRGAPTVRARSRTRTAPWRRALALRVSGANPVRMATTLALTLAEASEARVEVYDALGPARGDAARRAARCWRDTPRPRRVQPRARRLRRARARRSCLGRDARRGGALAGVRQPAAERLTAERPSVKPHPPCPHVRPPLPRPHPDRPCPRFPRRRARGRPRHGRAPTLQRGPDCSSSPPSLRTRTAACGGPRSSGG